MNTVLYVTLEVVRQVALLLQPVMPDATAKLLTLLGVPEATHASSQPSAPHSCPAPNCPHPHRCSPATKHPRHNSCLSISGQSLRQRRN